MSEPRGARIWIARVAIEAKTPFLVGTGGGDDLRDAIGVTDANGLPTIPGSTIAGVLRHAMADSELSDGCDAIFGFQDGARGASSRLEVSWAAVHDEENRPVPPMIAVCKCSHCRSSVHDEENRPVPPRGAALKSRFLTYLATGITRDHVRMDARGTAENAGKFDETLVPAGARFTFELALVDPREHETNSLMALLASPRLRFGRGTRRGLGLFQVVENKIRAREFDLKTGDDRKAFREIPRSLHEAERILKDAPLSTAQAAEHIATLTLSLTAEDFWLIGGGEPDETTPTRDNKIPDMLPMSEVRIIWTEGPSPKGQMSTRFRLLPAASVKGALRHRVAYHARRLAKITTPNALDQDALKTEAQPEEVKELFGEIKAKQAKSRAGRIFPSDLYLEDGHCRQGWLDHVSLDRFTSGPIDGALFQEAPLFRNNAPLEMVLEVEKPNNISPSAWKALDAAILDLIQGRLSLGAGGSRGHGFFTGERTWKNRNPQP